MQRNKILVAAGVLVALCAAGCSDNVPGNVANPSVPAFTTTGPVTVTGTTPPSPPTTQPPPTSSEPTVAPPNTPEPDQGAVSGECKVPELELSIGQGEGAAGTVYRPLRFTNKGTRTCVIQGFPGVSYVSGESQVGPAAFRVGTKGPAITLAPKETAFTPVGFVQVGNFDEGVCKPTPVTGVRVYPPHEYASVIVPMEGTGCAGTPPNPQLTVKTVQKGAGV